jgi:hypothetical protein
MCLQAVIGKPKKKSGIGYKYFYYDRHGVLRGEHYATDRIRPINQWLQSESYGNAEIIWGYHESYPAGFHIFKTKHGVSRWCGGHERGIRKVQYRKAVCLGTQEKCHVVVAKEMKILG